MELIDVHAASARHRHHHRSSNNDDRDASVTCPFKKTATAFTIKRKALAYPYASGTSVLNAYSGRWRGDYDAFVDIPKTKD